MITAGDLIAALQQLAPDTPVLVSGYEMGLTEALAPLATKVVLDEDAGSVFGEYEEAYPADNPSAMAAVYIGGKGHNLGGSYGFGEDVVS